MIKKKSVRYDRFKVKTTQKGSTSNGYSAVILNGKCQIQLKDNKKITTRELVILGLLKRGFSNKMISDETGITVNTVKYHLKKLYKKLDAMNRVEAINKFNEITNQKPMLR